MYRKSTEKDFNNNFKEHFKGYYDTLVLKVLVDESNIPANIEYEYNSQSYINKTIIRIGNGKKNKLLEGRKITGDSFKQFLDGLRDELLLRKFLFTVNDGYNYFDAKVDYGNIKNPNDDNNGEYREGIDALMLAHNISSATDNERFNFNQVAVLLKSFFKIVVKEDTFLTPNINIDFNINTSDDPKQMLLAIAVIATFTNN